VNTNFYFVNVILLSSGDMGYWKCKVCGNIQESKNVPDECNVCFSDKNSFEKIDDKNIDLIEGKDKKKKYRRVFKKGFDRKIRKKK
jgi:rubredoxin